MGILNRIGLIIARKWVGGIAIKEVITEAHRLNDLGEKVIINYLGEELKDNVKIKKNVSTYIDLLSEMKANNIDGHIAVKPTQLGLNLGYKIFLGNYQKIVKKANELGIFVWLDMEDYPFVDNTIKAYLSTLKIYKNIGICIQAKLRRSQNDIKKIAAKGGIIRLVKGAYKNRQGITYNSRQEIDRNYERCMHYLFSHATLFMIATHDDKLIYKAIAYEKKYKKKEMFGMLKGIRPSLSLKLVEKKVDMYTYVPFGEDWIDYSIRRLKEKEHSMLVLRSIFQG